MNPDTTHVVNREAGKQLYDRRQTEDLGDYYTRHIDAMTGEGLHSKSAIAAELAVRDRQIDFLLTMLAHCELNAMNPTAIRLTVEHARANSETRNP